MSDLRDREEGARRQTEPDRDRVQLVVAVIREPWRFDREAEELCETSTDLRSRTSGGRERCKEHTSWPDDTDDLGERLLPPRDQLEDPSQVCRAEHPVAERHAGRVPPYARARR